MKLHHIIVLLFVTLQSCSMCSQKTVDTSVATGSLEDVQFGETREVWSSLSEVGYPNIADTIPSLLLERYCYTFSYNSGVRQPTWVMWQPTDKHVTKKKAGVWNEYREDPELPSAIRSTLEDYSSSGYDKGHFCPGGDCNWNDERRDETFLLSNMCPQNPNLNRCDWKKIEITCRKWVKQYDNIYIVCGPIFFKSQEHVKIGPNQIPVPEGFFKVVLCAEPSIPRGIGFICRNTNGNRKNDFFVNSIRLVERVTDYQFFFNISDYISNNV